MYLGDALHALGGGGRLLVLRVAGHRAIQRNVPIHVLHADARRIDQRVELQLLLDRLADVLGHLSRFAWALRCHGQVPHSAIAVTWPGSTHGRPRIVPSPRRAWVCTCPACLLTGALTRCYQLPVSAAAVRSGGWLPALLHRASAGSPQPARR